MGSAIVFVVASVGFAFVFDILIALRRGNRVIGRLALGAGEKDAQVVESGRRAAKDALWAQWSLLVVGAVILALAYAAADFS